MIGGFFTAEDEGVLYLSRADVTEDFGTFSRHAFELEDREWPTVEHYYQAMKFADTLSQEKIRQATGAQQARKIGRSRKFKIREDWAQIKPIVMTRGLYTKCRTYRHIAEKLLATGDRKIVESSLYDYYWGCGRDRRGNNHYGRVMMNIRDKLYQEKNATIEK